MINVLYARNNDLPATARIRHRLSAAFERNPGEICSPTLNSRPGEYDAKASATTNRKLRTQNFCRGCEPLLGEGIFIEA